MERAVQWELLRVLQEKRISTLGSAEEKNVDVLFIACVNALPEDETVRGRVASQLIEVPPLHQRVDDIPILLNHFLSHDYPNSPVNDIRFRLAVKYMVYADTLLPSNVRSLKTLVRGLVYESLTEDITPEEDALRRA